MLADFNHRRRMEEETRQIPQKLARQAKLFCCPPSLLPCQPWLRVVSPQTAPTIDSNSLGQGVD